MNKKLKEVIENAKVRKDFGWYNYRWFLLIPTNKKYNGMFGKNGYNNMIILGYDSAENAYYRLNAENTDDFAISDMQFIQVDVPEEYGSGCVRVHFCGEMKVGGMPLSSVVAEKVEVQHEH